MFKSSLMCFPFSFGTLAVLSAWPGCIPVQFSTNISVLSTSYLCRSEQLEWWSLHTLWWADSWPFSFHSCLIWFWIIFPSQSVRFDFMVYANFDVLLELKCASFQKDCVRICGTSVPLHQVDIQNARHMSEFWFVFFFVPIFPWSDIAIILLPGCQPCALIL